MGNKIYKQYEFFSYMNACVDVIRHFVMNLVTLIHHKKCTYLSIVQFFIHVHSITWGTLVKKSRKYVNKNIGCNKLLGKNYKLISF
jgi:hypothetical protein